MKKIEFIFYKVYAIIYIYILYMHDINVLNKAENMITKIKKNGCFDYRLRQLIK